VSQSTTPHTADVLPPKGTGDVVVAVLVAVYVTLLGPAVGLVWAAVAPKLSIPLLAAQSDATFHAQIGADAWFLLVGGIAGLLSVGLALLATRGISPGVAVGLAVGGAAGAVVADRVGYLTERGTTSAALRAIGAHDLTGALLSEIDFRIRALGVLTIWPIVSVVVIGVVAAAAARRA
jgi:hypothetical protein